MPRKVGPGGRRSVLIVVRMTEAERDAVRRARQGDEPMSATLRRLVAEGLRARVAPKGKR